MKKATIILVITGICLFLGYWFYPKTEAEQAFNEFLTTQHKESYIVLPLCNTGEKVIPLVIEKIKNKDLERRRYAIGFLGSGDYPQAIPVLETIVKDESEIEVFRGDALEAIYFIDKQKGKKLAQQFRERSDFLGRVANEVIQDKITLRKEEICNPTD